MSMKKIIITITILLISNPALSAISIPSYGKHPVRQDIKYMSCDINFYQNGNGKEGKVYGNDYELVANKAFVYALMASNAYEKNPQFEIPDWNRLQSEDVTTWMGLSLNVYISIVRKEIVLAFKGTDKYSLNDWLFGNLNVFWKGQYGAAEKIIDKISNDYKGYKIITTGHSLGGGLALHCSMYRNNVDGYAFNSSPRIFNSKLYTNDQSYRLLISEKGEVLDALRKKWPSLKIFKLTETYSDFDFLKDSPVAEHGIYYIARGLTAVAASTGNGKAREIMRINLGCN